MPSRAGERLELARAQQYEQLAAAALDAHGRDAAFLEVDPGAGELFCDCRADELDAIEAVCAAIPREVGGVTLSSELIRRWPAPRRRSPSSTTPTAPST